MQKYKDSEDYFNSQEHKNWLQRTKDNQCYQKIPNSLEYSDLERFFYIQNKNVPPNRLK